MDPRETEQTRKRLEKLKSKISKDNIPIMSSHLKRVARVIGFTLNTALLLLAAGGVYFWLSTPVLAANTLQLVGMLVLLYFGIRWHKNQENLRAKHSNRPNLLQRNHSFISFEVTILTVMSLLLISETGAIASPLFFLLYFLLFGVALLYEIEATLVLTGTLLMYFLFLPSTEIANPTHLTQLMSLVMVTPLAIFTGHQYEQMLEEKNARVKLAKHISQEETDTLLFLSLNLKSSLVSALDSLSTTIPQTTTKVRTHLTGLYQDLKNLYRSADELQNLIDRESDQDK